MGTKEASYRTVVKTGRTHTTRFWVGWGSQLTGVETSFPKWVIRGQRMPFTGEVVYSYAAIVDAVDRESAWQKVVEAFADADESFVKQKPNDYWPPADRFPKAS